MAIKPYSAEDGVQNYLQDDTQEKSQQQAWNQGIEQSEFTWHKDELLRA